MSPAPTPRPEDLQESYAAIEQVYAEQNWPEVEARCRSLLAHIPDEPDDPLRQRLLLLLAHTQLYGAGDPAAAASLYRAVLTAEAEPVLKEIAAQGLAQCGQPYQPRQPQEVERLTEAGEAVTETADPISEAGASSPNAVEPGTDALEAVTEAGAPIAEVDAPMPDEGLPKPDSTDPAMPWLQELNSTKDGRPKPVQPAASRAPFQEPLLQEPLRALEEREEQVAVVERVEVVEEPEQIAVALADPERRDTITVAVAEGDEAARVDWPVTATAAAEQPLGAEEPVADQDAFSAEEEAELSRGLLRVVVRRDP